MKNTAINTLIIYSCLSATMSLSAQSESAPKDRARNLLQNSCAVSGCHAPGGAINFLNRNGEIDWPLVKSISTRITARIDDGSMPPAGTTQLSSEDRKALSNYLGSLATAAPSFEDRLASLRVPKGFQVEVFAKAKGARSLTVSPDGIVFVGTGGFSNVDPEGRVFAIVPSPNGNKVMALARGLNNPNGVALKGNDLYVAEEGRILKFKDALPYVKENISKDLGQKSAPFTVIYSGFYTEGSHSWKYLGFGPDGKLYVNIGAPCNVCLKDRNVFASIFRMNENGGEFELVAKGVRNTVGFDWDLESKTLWFTDNGRDMLGDNTPADELNRLDKIGQDFGFPYCHAKSLTDPQFNSKNCDGPEFTKPVIELGPHVAALGLTFYRGKQFPPAYHNQIFIAEHGSWNRSKKNGYRLSLVQSTKGADGKEVKTYKPFLSGWLNDSEQSNWGRPVDVKNYIDGSLLLSDDQGGIVYRIFYRGEN